MSNSLTRRRPDAAFVVRIIGIVLFAYFFFGFMLLPCLNTLTSIFTTKNAAGETDPWAVIRFFFAGNMGRYVWNSLKLAICLVVTVNVVGVSIVLLTEYFDIKGANILRLGYMTTMIYSGVALVTGYLFLYDPNGILTTALADAIPGFNRSWFSGFNAVLFTMTFACTSNHALFLRNAIRGIDYNTVEAARNMGAKPFKVLWKVVFPTLVPTMFSLTVMTFITGLCAMSAPTLLGYDSINPEIVRLAGSSVADESFPQAAVHHSGHVHHRAADGAVRLRAQGPLPVGVQDQGQAGKAEDHQSRVERAGPHLRLCAVHHLHDPRGDDHHLLLPDLRSHPHEEAGPQQLDPHQLLWHPGL